MQRDPDFRLIVWYHGLKATQYFSKFTPESVSVLKRDLTILGLPQPKNQNISLLSHGAVECFWPAAGMNAVLHKNLVVKTNRTPAFYVAINQLSILSITVKETSAPFPSDLVKHTSLKRPYEQRASTSAVPMGQLVDTPRGQQTLHNHDASGYRPQPAHPSALPSHSFSCDDSRPRKAAKTHAQAFQLSAQRTVDNGHPRNSFEPLVPTNRLQASTSTEPAVYPSSRVNPPRPPARVATNSASSMTNITKTNLQPLRMPSHLGTGVEKGRANASLNTLELQSTASKREPPRQSVPLPRKPVSHNVPPSKSSALSNDRMQSHGPTAAVTSEQVGQVSSRNSTTVWTDGSSFQVPTPSTSAPSPDVHSHANLQSTTSLPTPVSPWLNSESVQHLVQRMTSGQGTTTPLIPPTPISIKEAGASTVQPAVMNPTTPQLTMGLKEVSRNIGEWFAEGHGVPRKNTRQDREKELELEKAIEELNVIKKELEEERRSRREDKELLDIERHKREEAEHALADVRRECRQPFVVPSLLDAFVELSKLTTRGLKVSGSQVEIPVYPSPQGRREVEDAPRAVVNGRSITAPKNEAPVVQWTKVKREPLEDQVML